MKNWKYVVQFVQIIDKYVERGVNAKELARGLERLDRGFQSVTTIKETAEAARNINDSFRRK
jgi:uncharacterized protein YktA (UPF0223 family)